MQKLDVKVLEMNSSVNMAADSPAITSSPHSCFAPGFPFLSGLETNDS
ncbi:hypothetical protein [Pedobacter sp. Leaf216]|nr:hypothetical protein [Pedobacter sp. Leaf216]